MVDNPIKTPENIVFVTGSTHPELAKDIANELDFDLGAIQLKEHPDSQQYVRYLESVRGKHVIILQPHVAVDGRSVADSLHQELEMICAAKLASANEITSVNPHLAGSRQDRKAKGRESISTALNIRLLAAAGVSRMVSVDLHSSQTSALFYGPFDHLTAQPILRNHIKENTIEDIDECVVVSADAGNSKTAAYHGKHLGLDVVYLNKGRDTNFSNVVTHHKEITGVKDRVCLLFDDMIDTAGTISSASDLLKEQGAKATYVIATHGFFSGPAIERINNSSINKVIVTDTLPVRQFQDGLREKLEIVPVGPMIARALAEIVTNGSVSELFDDENHQ